MVKAGAGYEQDYKRPESGAQKSSLLFVISSVLMLLSALPMTMWCLSLIDTAALDRAFVYAGLGCFIAAIIYVFSLVTAIAGLTLPKRAHYLRWRRIPAQVQLAAGIALVAILLPYAVLVLPPLLVLTLLYLIGIKKF